MKKRRLEIVVLSDIHLGSYTCHADELLNYLSSIDPKKLILNGDILDTRAMGNNYFPPAQLKIIREIFSMAAKGTEVFYITGNHDDAFLKFDPSYVGYIKITNRLSIKLNGKNTLFFNGDIFDYSLRYSHWLLSFGSIGFNLAVEFAEMQSKVLGRFGRKNEPAKENEEKDRQCDPAQTSLFEKSVVKMAIDQHYDHVVCGHSHSPKKEIIETERGDCLYLNSGDWVENMTAFEYSFKRWKLYRYENDKLASFYKDEKLKSMDMNNLIASITD